MSLSKLRELVMDMLQFMGSQRVGHDWATELNWIHLNFIIDRWGLTIAILSIYKLSF